jgi:diguanylate cyclase (GGDEF)-like protein
VFFGRVVVRWAHNGDPIGIIGFAQDITEKKMVELELKRQRDLLNYQAYHDHLTNLPNRLLFEDRLEQSIIKREHESFALLFIDLDNFKEINDTLRHHIGDKVLQNISKKLSTCVRAEDSLSRLGGDEFTVILQNIKTPTAAAEVAQKLLDLISMKLIINNTEIYLSASIGISICPKDSTVKSDLIKFADSAMYKAKESGKNGYQFYSSDMTTMAFEKIMLQNSMRIAITNKEFQVYYQPQMDATSESLIGMEALVRWSHPDLGMIPPYKFIPLAEESGFIIHLDNYVMKQAMQDFARWKNMNLNAGKLSLNLSMKQLNNDDFIGYLTRTAKESDFSLEWLELEITETQMMQDPLSSIEKLNTLTTSQNSLTYPLIPAYACISANSLSEILFLILKF